MSHQHELPREDMAAHSRAIEIGTDVATDELVTMPVEELLTGRALLFGQSGSGKSNSANVVAEELLDRGHAILIVDTDGEYYGLKEDYEVLHATGDEEGDIQVGPEHADRLATLAIEQNVPVILDVSAFLDPEDADELVGRVARVLFAKAKKLKKPFLLIVEEAHEYVPEGRGGGGAADHITRIAKRGRKHGLGFLGVSQRPANVDKDVVTQNSWLAWHRLTYRNDTGVVRDLYGSEAAEAVEGLDDGEALVQADWFEDLRRVQWRRQRTFDAGATPGLEDTEHPELRSIDADVLDDLRAAGDTARSREERIADLEEQLAEREARIDELERETERLEDRNAWEEMMAERAFEGLSADIDGLDIDLGAEGSIRAEVLEIVEERDDLADDLADVRVERDELRERVADLEGEVEAVRTERDRLQEQLDREAELHQFVEDLQELVADRYPDVLETARDDQVADLRRELRDARERIQELEERRPEAVDLEEDLLANDVVREHIESAAESCRYAADSVWDVVVALSSLANGETGRAGELKKQVGSAEKTVLAICNHLVEQGVAEKDTDGRYNAYALDREALRDRIRLADQRAAIEQRREAVHAGGKDSG